jgi:hypothetical protein
MFRPNWVILRQRTSYKEFFFLFLLHCVRLDTSYLHSRLRLHYVVGVSHSIHRVPCIDLHSFVFTCVFVVAITFLPNYFLATIGDTHTNTQTDGRDMRIKALRWTQVP